MALHQITASEWNAVLGKGGNALPGDMVELLPGMFTGQDFKIHTPGVTVKVAAPGVIFDGQYKWPQGTTANVGPTGLEVTMEGLIEILASDVTLDLTGAQLIRSRGKGVSAPPTKDGTRLKNLALINLQMDGLRQAPVRFDNVDGAKILSITAKDFGNYFQAFRPGPQGGWPMGVNAVNCTNVEMAYCDLDTGWGEGIGVSRDTVGAKVHHNRTHRLMGVHFYLHGCSDAEIWDNYALEDGNYLRAGSPPDLFVINPGELQYEGKQSLGSKNIRGWNNIARGGYHNFGVWAGGAAKLSNVEWIHNTSINAKPGAKRTGHGAILVRGGANVTGLRFEANMLHQNDGEYGEIAKGLDVPFDGNGWAGPLPLPNWNTRNDILHVPLRNPDGDPLDLGNYEPTVPAGLLADTGVDDDFTGLPRKYWTVGAIEHIPAVIDPPPPPLPTTETIGVMVVIDVASADAPAVRTALAAAKVTVS